MCSSMQRILWLMNVFALSCSNTCWEAWKECETDFQCAVNLGGLITQPCNKALGFRYDGLFPEITGSMEPKCPLKCVQAIKNLTSTPKGKAVDSCVCKDGDGLCLALKARLQRCVNSREKNFTIFSCTAARVKCNNDTNCKKAQFSFLKRCSQLIPGVKCTQDCKASQDELLGSELGKALLECDCDGREEPYCLGIRSNYERLCKATRETRDPDVPTVMERSYYVNSSLNSQFGLPLWILYAAIIAHVYVLYNR